MVLDTIEQTDLTPSERSKIVDDEKRWRRLGTGAHLDDWLSIGETLMIGRRLAMKIAHVNRPEGRGYAETMGRWMAIHGFDTMPKTAVSCVLWLLDDAERIGILRDIRASMTVGERSRLNSPISARQRVEKMLSQDKAPRTFRLKEQVEQQRRTIAELEAKLTTAERRDGSLFDLRKDKAADIVDVIVKTISASKVELIARGLMTAVKKPAG